MQPLLSNGLCLRPFEDRDAEPFALASRESVATVGRWMPWCHSEYSAVHAREWFALCSQGFADRSGFEFGVFAADGTELLGGAGLNQFNKKHNFCNLGYWVRESKQRQAVATRVVRILSEFGFTELALTRIEIVVAEGNEPSNGVARMAGARFECFARNRLLIGGVPVGASVYSLVPNSEP
jgi:ribosomal-protein-serine acetyltransferase